MRATSPFIDADRKRSPRLSKWPPAIRLTADNVPFAALEPNGKAAMSKMIFISLPVADLDASLAFYKALGFVGDPSFSDATAACMVWSEAIKVMLVTQAKWRTFTDRPIPPSTSSEVALNLACDSREAVDAMNEAAAANGGTADINPVQEYGTMYGRDMADPDGHIWGAFWMDAAAIPADGSTT
jgi:predicted lactoylglutathione lyase